MCLFLRSYELDMNVVYIFVGLFISHTYLYMINKVCPTTYSPHLISPNQCVAEKMVTVPVVSLRHCESVTCSENIKIRAVARFRGETHRFLCVTVLWLREISH